MLVEHKLEIKKNFDIFKEIICNYEIDYLNISNQLDILETNETRFF